MGDTAVVQRYMTWRCKSHSQLQVTASCKSHSGTASRNAVQNAAAGGDKAAAAAAVLQR
jgi:hypothetical protein